MTHCCCALRPQEPGTLGKRQGVRAIGEELARDINRHATVVLAGCRAVDPSQVSARMGRLGILGADS